MKQLLEFLSGRPRYQIALLCLFLVALFATIDYATGPDLSVFIFYLVPVFLSTWFISDLAGILLSLLSAAAWSLADVLSFRTYSSAIIPYWNLAMELAFFLSAVYLLSLLRSSLEHEKRMARTDFLTGAVNSRLFRELAQAEIIRAERYNHPFTVVYLDVDDFKEINDRLGHSDGDALLKHLVRTIQTHIRASDTVARLGGDEFALLLPETDFVTARTVLDKVRKMLETAMQVNGWDTTFSFGMLTFTTPPESVDLMVKLTDELMYQAKGHGKNRMVCSQYGGPGGTGNGDEQAKARG